MSMTITDIYPIWDALTPEQRWVRIRRDHDAAALALRTTPDGPARDALTERANLLYDAALYVSGSVKAWRESSWWDLRREL
jgi:hypothetical protein